MFFLPFSFEITPQVYQNSIDLLFLIFILFFIILFIIGFAKICEKLFSHNQDLSALTTAWMFIRFIGLCVMTYLAFQVIHDNTTFIAYTSIALMLGIDILNTKSIQQSENRIIAAFERSRK